MSRNFRNTLLFESALDSIGPEKPVLYSVAQSLLSPTVQVLEEDCNTLLGQVMPLSYRVQGQVEVGTGQVITPSRVLELILAGKTSVSVRTLSTCLVSGGVCQKCLYGSRPDRQNASMGTRVKVESEILIDVGLTILEPTGDTIPLKYPLEDFDTAYLFIDGVFQTRGSTLVDGSPASIVLSTPSRSQTDCVVRYAVKSNVPYFYWIADTFAGSLLGVKSVEKLPLPLRQDLIESFIPKEDITDLIRQLSVSPIGPEDVVEYLKVIKNPLEQAIFAVLLGALIL